MNEAQAELNAEMTEENLIQDFESALVRNLRAKAREIITKTIKLGFEKTGRQMNQQYHDHT